METKILYYINMGKDYRHQNDYLLRSELSKSIDNKIFFAGEATSIEEYGFAHGALRTGIREAEKIKNSFKAIKK